MGLGPLFCEFVPSCQASLRAPPVSHSPHLCQRTESPCPPLDGLAVASPPSCNGASMSADPLPPLSSILYPRFPKDPGCCLACQAEVGRSRNEGWSLATGF